MIQLILIVFFFLLVLDFITTEWGIACGLYEYNPFIKFIHNRYGWKGHLGCKIILFVGLIFGIGYTSVEAVLVLYTVFLLIILVNLWGLYECLNLKH